jgi:hypothetical protein
MNGKKPPQHDPAAATVRAGPNMYHLEESFSKAAEEALARCREHLHTGALDWSVSATDARNVMAALAPLDYAELVAVVHRLGETADGRSNLLAKLYERGLDTAELCAEWRKLLSQKFLGAAKVGRLLPDLNLKFADYQATYVPASVLARGF